MLIQEPDEPGRKGGDNATTALALVTSPERAALAPKERIYVGLDIGYREHVAAASPLSVFNVGRRPDGWKRVKPIHFASDATGFGRFQRYLDRHSPDPRDFLILLEPTGSYGLTVLLYLLSKGYRVLQVETRAVKDYREKIFGSKTKTDDTDARLMARMDFLHELVGEEFSIQPVLLMNPDAAALRRDCLTNARFSDGVNYVWRLGADAAAWTACAAALVRRPPAEAESHMTRIASPPTMRP